jgi:hypothetical protein
MPPPTVAIDIKNRAFAHWPAPKRHVLRPLCVQCVTLLANRLVDARGPTHGKMARSNFDSQIDARKVRHSVVLQSHISYACNLHILV